MGSYAKLAKRALETDMPVMVQVIWSCFLLAGEFSLYGLICGKFALVAVSFFLMNFGSFVFVLFRYKSWSVELKMSCL